MNIHVWVGNFNYDKLKTIGRTLIAAINADKKLNMILIYVAVFCLSFFSEGDTCLNFDCFLILKTTEFCCENFLSIIILSGIQPIYELFSFQLASAVFFIISYIYLEVSQTKRLLANICMWLKDATITEINRVSQWNKLLFDTIYTINSEHNKRWQQERKDLKRPAYNLWRHSTVSISWNKHLSHLRRNRSLYSVE